MNFLLSLDDAERPARGFVQFDGETGRADHSPLTALSTALLRVGRVTIDLSEMRCVPFALVAWLLREQRSIARRGGHLSVARAPAALTRILSTIGLSDSLELTDVRA